MSEQDNPTEPKADSLPSVPDLKKGISKTGSKKREDDFNQRFAEAAIKNERSYVHLKGLTDHYKHKGCWSYFLMFLMLLMIVFQSVLLGLVGGGIWTFEKYSWLLPALLAQNLAQIVGLAVFVVKALFKDMKAE